MLKITTVTVNAIGLNNQLRQSLIKLTLSSITYHAAVEYVREKIRGLFHEAFLK